MELIDFAAAYWLLVKWLLYAGAIVIFVSSLDDLFVDGYYWIRRVNRAVFKRRKWPPLDAARLYELPQKPIAIMVPAWQEADVIGRMADYAARTFDYENFHIFVGTYPNDAETQAAVDETVRTHPNLHKVVVRDPGPTNKADCLNNIIAGILEYEAKTGTEFACVVLHDAEDVVHPLELRLFNYLIPRKDMVQLPVLPIARPWYDLVGGTYLDEFAEWHGKDMVVRESLTGNVPSAGVATAISRRAVIALAEKNGGVVFDTASLTEDYQIGFKLQEIGAESVFVRFPVHFAGPKPEWCKSASTTELVAVREYFPGTFQTSMRQKSRWIVGIVFQGWKSLGWRSVASVRYMMFRDRKGALTNCSVLMAYFLVVNIVLMLLVSRYRSGAWNFPALIPAGSWFWTLLLLNGGLMLNRLLHRFYFTARLYGPLHGVMSIPRIVVSNIVNVAAFFRGLRQFRAAERDGNKVAWDKTTHDFPDTHGTGAQP